MCCTVCDCTHCSSGVTVSCHAAIAYQFTIFHFDCIQVPCCVGKINIDVQAGPDGIASKYSYPHPKPQLREAQLCSQPEPVPVDGTAQRGEVCPKGHPRTLCFSEHTS